MGNKEPASTVIKGAQYMHPEGIRYRIDSILLNATGYESGKELKTYILYTQLDAGSYPVGTQWVREEKDFLNVFELAAEAE